MPRAPRRLGQRRFFLLNTWWGLLAGFVGVSAQEQQAVEFGCAGLILGLWHDAGLGPTAAGLAGTGAIRTSGKTRAKSEIWIAKLTRTLRKKSGLGRRAFLVPRRLAYLLLSQYPNVRLKINNDSV